MKYLSKLEHSRRAEPGLEWAMLKRLPVALLAGTLIPLAIWVLSRLNLSGGFAPAAKYLTNVEIMSIAAVVTVWMTVASVAFGCAVVIIMKCPAYVADACHLPDSERPAAERKSFAN